ncbi:hypothetical protein Csa_002886 [Cucumis sativus]|uniref:Uncharacterized protein n=1 Tax=Cucumis sativus TaxID=3659 RepID=A0A0A0KEJ5_CUCSA|nr:hypothetical protein Csa_002886 [Cucumis sativus]
MATTTTSLIEREEGLRMQILSALRLLVEPTKVDCKTRIFRIQKAAAEQGQTQSSELVCTEDRR